MSKAWKFKAKANTAKNPCNRCENVHCKNYDGCEKGCCTLGRNFRVCPLNDKLDPRKRKKL